MTDCSSCMCAYVLRMQKISLLSHESPLSLLKQMRDLSAKVQREVEPLSF